MNQKLALGLNSKQVQRILSSRNSLAHELSFSRKSANHWLEYILLLRLIHRAVASAIGYEGRIVDVHLKSGQLVLK
jgi:hypothetical protein